ncbi:hypothetical protein DPMN_039087 [Dreissena polymorpha]|uniref:Uncharacterized protein n=1 Tax=Dreissena polymorpha TaxID=45954 RepID=A0A9D4MED8_DREPO|nr:hypothetical protein DPMN_039087 [Dreissena polymorpha]
MPQVIRLAERLPVVASGDVLRPILTGFRGSNSEMHLLSRCEMYRVLYKALTAPHDHAALRLPLIEPSNSYVHISHCSGVLGRTHHHTTHL